MSLSPPNIFSPSSCSLSAWSRGWIVQEVELMRGQAEWNRGPYSPTTRQPEDNNLTPTPLQPQTNHKQAKQAHFKPATVQPHINKNSINQKEREWEKSHNCWKHNTQPYYCWRSINYTTAEIYQRLIHVSEHLFWHIIKNMRKIIIGNSKNIMTQQCFELFGAGLTSVA